MQPRTFIHQLHSILQEPDLHNLICWSPMENNIFLLKPHDPNFSTQVLKRYFKHGNISSFVRQLHMYGFHKLPSHNHMTNSTANTTTTATTINNNDMNFENRDKDKASVEWHFTHPSGHFYRDADASTLNKIQRKSAGIGKDGKRKNVLSHVSVSFINPTSKNLLPATSSGLMNSSSPSSVSASTTSSLSLPSGISSTTSSSTVNSTPILSKNLIGQNQVFLNNQEASHVEQQNQIVYRQDLPKISQRHSSSTSSLVRSIQKPTPVGSAPHNHSYPNIVQQTSQNSTPPMFKREFTLTSATSTQPMLHSVSQGQTPNITDLTRGGTPNIKENSHFGAEHGQSTYVLPPPQPQSWPVATQQTLTQKQSSQNDNAFIDEFKKLDLNIQELKKSVTIITDILENIFIFEDNDMNNSHTNNNDNNDNDTTTINISHNVELKNKLNELRTLADTFLIPESKTDQELIEIKK
ncbi:hypothetical protein KAFR_0B04410 [Kazachstania africana CBS 2517]|uniref:HSF-type DNA-binding domain-containing protein n=1 Tax=Kazachstania africana (strain ATCC 22294 / BCRC 22015 / CBS 2517 / CECT 1963 / NBRC 1671 / NRRL Y-8276) TaxID=1071382 RepID=H2AQT7_KAZAF|nr:hypothetical protein KAFR_0B04410 [Kazachstania africana CBS 2517]CCF56737.1 hypothetical protein KAFR_0B04410 [Kazachstania africana CBS 2517]